jgi:hypothetical protein
VRITDLRKEPTAGGARVAARVEWEDSARPPLDLFFETESPCADDLAPSPEAVLAACFLPAFRHGERRIVLEGPVCPRLAESARTAAKILDSWHQRRRRAPTIEPERGFLAPRPRSPRRTALFLTGGVDSTHMLRRNRVEFPADHADSFRDALAVFGIYAPGQIDPLRPFAAYARILEVLREIASAAGCAFVPVVTNATALDPEVEFIARESLSSALLSAAHLFSSRWSDISLASGRDVSILAPLGSHPLLDSRFASSALEVRHVGITWSRRERLEQLCAVDGGTSRLVVCMAGPAPPLVNCGKCEKCLRTMTALAGLGKLEEAREFPRRVIGPADIEALSISPHYSAYWADVLPLLGPRPDLARAVEAKLERARRDSGWFDDRGWKGAIRRLDRKLLGGRLLDLRRRLAGAS